MFTVVGFVPREHSLCSRAVWMNRDIPCFIGAHFQPPFCKMDEFNKKKKLLLLATSLSVTKVFCLTWAVIDKEKKV